MLKPPALDPDHDLDPLDGATLTNRIRSKIKIMSRRRPRRPLARSPSSA
jgi:hypothetical protein